jgi:outer membrane protein OmpA-like peptidoglycan-associated protein
MLQNKLREDSLAVASKNFALNYQTLSTEHDSIVTALEISISNLRRQLWDTELRAGMAEADKSAYESDLNQRREREQAIQDIQADFGPEEGEVLLTPEGDVIIRVFGFSFAVGSAEMNAAHEPLMNSLAAAVAKFPGAGLRIEGHTDNTGGRESNLRLSRRRAETVSRLLLERLEQMPSSVETVGFGPDRPLATNSTTEGRARNRRIDVVILAGGS